MGYAELPYEALSSIAFMDAPIGIMVLSNRRIMRVNAAIETLFGWSSEELEGQSTRILYPSTVDYEKTGIRWHRWLESRPLYEDERFMRHRSGEIIWMRARGRTLTPDEPFQLMVWTFETVKERRLAESSALTRREREIVRKVVNGQSSKEIAIALGISPRTVEVHRASLMSKLGVRNVAELLSKVIVER